jgi:hypothetical protein
VITAVASRHVYFFVVIFVLQATYFIYVSSAKTRFVAPQILVSLLD